MEALRSELEEVRRCRAREEAAYRDSLSALKEQGQSAMDAVSRKLQDFEAKLARSNAKCRDLEARNERDQQSMATLSSRHQQV